MHRIGCRDAVSRRVFVRLDLVGIVGEQRELAAVAVVDKFAIDLPAALPAVEIPGAGPLAGGRNIGRIAAAKSAAVEPHIGARGAIGTDRLGELHAHLLSRSG